MKIKICALFLIVCSNSVLASQYFDEPRARPEGAPDWVNLPIAMSSENKFCQEKGFSSGSPVNIEFNSLTSMYVIPNSLD